MFRQLTAPIADRQQAALVGEHRPEDLVPFPEPDLEERLLVHVPHRERRVGEEVAGVDVAVGFDGRLDVGDRAVRAPRDSSRNQCEFRGRS